MNVKLLRTMKVRTGAVTDGISDILGLNIHQPL